MVGPSRPFRAEGLIMGTAPDHAADFSWHHHGRGFLLSPYGMTALSFSLTGVEQWRKGETWCMRPTYAGIVDSFCVDPQQIPQYPFGDADGDSGDFEGGPTYNDADLPFHEWDFVFHRNFRELDPDIMRLNPNALRRREWGNVRLGDYNIWELSPDAGWGDVTNDTSDPGDEPGGPEDPVVRRIPKFVWVGSEIDLGEPDVEKQVYIGVYVNDCRQKVFVNIGRKMHAGVTPWDLDDWAMLSPSQANAGFSLAGCVFKPFVYVYQWETFNLGEISFKFKVLDYRTHLTRMSPRREARE